LKIIVFFFFSFKTRAAKGKVKNMNLINIFNAESNKIRHGVVNDLLWLVYPSICASCNNSLNSGEICICTWCRLHLPLTDFHVEADNPVAKHFWGKVPVVAGTAAYYFTKGEKVQRLIHNLKYKGRKDIGVFIGELYGHTLKRSSLFYSVEVIVPVPIHVRKQRKRGYNQSDYFAEGLSTAMNIPFETKALRRIIDTDSQTRKKRYSRFESMRNAFDVGKPKTIEGKHVLLVDDVITTGSTLISCAQTILQVSGTKVSIATIAHA
jgi:ComF family protein